MTHFLKLNEKFVNDVRNGLKNFECRFNDRNYCVGDTICFTDLENKPLVLPHYKITYVLSYFEGLTKGFVILGIKACSM